MNNANYVPYSYLSAYYDKMSVLIYDAILLCTPKTSVKFLFSFAALIFFPPHGLSYGINRYRAGAKVWQRALEIKGRAFGFQKNLHTVG